MPDYTHILQMLDELYNQINAIKDELGRLQYQGGDTGSNIDLTTGLPAAPKVPSYIPPLTVEDGSGTAGKEIVGGEETDEFPDCCAVGDDSDYYCTGTLIAPNVVVTADHCPNVTRVFLKGKDISKPQDGETIPVTQEFSHPEVDLKVLVLEKDSQVSPRHVAQRAEVYNVEKAVVAGFGTIDVHGTFGYGIKRRAEVPVMSIHCGEPTDTKDYGCVQHREIVAGHVGLKRDSCRGDSGGPLYIAAPDGDYYLLGATSRGARNSFTTCGDGGIYVRVDRCLDWIREITGVNIEGSRI
jgi:hypothetical protein